MLLKRPLEHWKYMGMRPDRVLWTFPLMCNLKCNHCEIGKLTAMGKGGKKEDGLTLEQNKIIVKKIRNWLKKPYSLSFLAGEPLMHSEILELINYAQKNLAITSLTSNGTLIQTSETAEKIVNSGLEFLALSLDALSAEIQDTSRGVKGVKDKVFKAVKLLQMAKLKLKSNNPKIYINAILMNDNLNEIVPLIELSKKLNVNGITFQPIASSEYFSSTDERGEKWYQKNKNWPETKKINNLIDQLILMKKNGYPIQNSDTDFANFKEYFLNPINFGNNNVCTGSLKTMVITPKGKMRVCMSEDLGDVLTADLNKTWFSSEAREAKGKISCCKSQCKILACNKDDFYF